jgi:hypothetical protein
MHQEADITGRAPHGDDMLTALTPRAAIRSGNSREARSHPGGAAREILAAVQSELEDLSSRWPQLILLPIAPLRAIDDLIRLELAVKRELRPEGLLEDERLANALRVVLGMARARWRTDPTCQVLPQPAS